MRIRVPPTSQALRVPLEYLYLRIIKSEEHTDTTHTLALLRPRGQRPSCRCTGFERDELAPPHSITSSARPSIGIGRVIPRTLAVLRLIYNSIFVAC